MNERYPVFDLTPIKENITCEELRVTERMNITPKLLEQIAKIDALSEAIDEYIKKKIKWNGY